MKLKILKAGNGDALLLSFCDNKKINRNILIDCGNNKKDFENHIFPELEKIIKNDENIDLAIGTHSDQDHIKGFEYLFKKVEQNKTSIKSENIKKFWFNSSYKNSKYEKGLEISFKETLKLEEHLSKNINNQWKRDIIFNNGEEINFYGAKITILSPNLTELNKYQDKLETFEIAKSNDYGISLSDLMDNYEDFDIDLDDEIANASSIAFIFEYNDKSILFLGDAIPETIENSLDYILKKREISILDIDYLKLSHHGSIRSISNKILDMIDCNNFIISTNGKKGQLPNKSTIAQILSHETQKDKKTNFYFNFENNSVKNNFNSTKLNFKDFEIQEKKICFFDAKASHKNGNLITL